MKQVSLDDLIKQDKQKKLQNRSSQQFRARKNNRDNKPGFRPRRDRDDRNFRPKGFKRNNWQERRERPIPQNNKRISFKRRRQLINRQRNVRNRNFDTRPIKSHTEKSQNAVQKQFKTLHVMGLHPDFTNQDLNNLFAAQGALQKCIIEQDNFGRSITTAIVRYHSSQSAKNAIKNLNQHKIMNSVLTVQPYKRKPRR